MNKECDFSGTMDTKSDKENEENEKGVDSSEKERVKHDTAVKSAEADIDYCKEFSQSMGEFALNMSDMSIMEASVSGNIVAGEQEKELVSSIIADMPAFTLSDAYQEILDRSLLLGKCAKNEKYCCNDTSTHDACNQILPSDFCEMPYDILAGVDSLSFCVLQDEHRDGNTYCCGEKKAEVVGEKTDAGLFYSVSSVQESEIPLEISHSVSSPNNYCHSDVPKVILGRSPIADTSIEDEERKGEVNSGCHMMHLHSDSNNVHSSSGQRDMEGVKENRYIYSYSPESFAKDSLAKESVGLSVALRDQTHEKQQKAYGNIISTSIDDAEMIQMKNNIFFKLGIEASSDLFPTGGSSLNVVQELSNVNLHCTEELSVPHQFHAPPNVVASGHSNSFSVPPMEKDYGGYSCPRTSVSTQITSTRKSIEESRIVRAVSEDKKLANIINDPHESMKILSEYVKRTRSCFTKRARSSIWGSLVNVFQVFEQYNLPKVNQLCHYSRQKTRSSRTSRKCGRKRRGRGSLSSGKKRGALSTCVRLKIKSAKQLDPKNLTVVLEEMVNVPSPDSNAYGNGLYRHHICETPTADNDVEDDNKERPDILQTASAEESDNNVACGSASNLVLRAADEKIKFSEGNLVKNTANDHLLTATQKEIEKGVTENVYVEPGTSPDSEVINLIPDSGLEERAQDDLGVSPLCSDDPVVAPRDVRALTFSCSYHKEGKKNDKSSKISNCNLESSLEPARKPLEKRVAKKKKGKVDFDKHSSEDTAHGPLSEASNVFGHLPDLKDELNGSGAYVCLTSDLPDYEKSASPTEEGCKLLKSSKSRKKNNLRSKVSDVARGSRGKACRQKGSRKKQAPFEVEAISNANRVVCEVETHPEIGNLLVNKFGNPYAADTAGLEEKSQDIIMNGEVEPCRLQNAWVSCDDCHKWRRIPAALADSIGETDQKWTCKDNMDKEFAECSVPQEKSNAAINEELDITDGSGEEDSYGKDLDSNKSKRRGSKAVPKKAPFAPIKSNIFLHRRRRTQTIDEIMVCHCKAREDGHLGCGEECLNRMLNIECVKGTCPCGDNCSNQQFQKRKYAKVNELKCGKKGYGLQLLEDICKGQFLIEYVGEVLDLQAYEARQKEYASQGHKHFYFMTLNGSEVIDACAKGNLGRFINHSCEPNCRTEKWIVNGEICIGLFALRDIKKGEEVTFDYNYVRVFGAAAKKCVCGSSQCRGFIGGDPLNSEVIVQSDSDDDYPEPVMVGGDGEPCDATDDAVTTSKEFYNEEIQMAELSNDLDKMHSSATEIVDLDISMDVVSASASPPSRLSAATEESVGEPPSASIFQEETIVEGQSARKSLSSGKRSETSSQTETDAPEEDQVSSKSLPVVKSSHKSSLVKKSKYKGQHGIAYKMQPTANRSIKVFALPVGDGFGAVQEKLNELLDTSGGLSKRRDATRGYLKLLLLTAASGDNGNGETIQSNRDLSMILDALLKTKSRAVLIDIINKNGLRMLHNVMKKYRSDFKKIPILRKLLKVLEFLAEKGILTCDHISGGPPCPGMESFLESMLSLTEHDDKQVHRIARSFRDRWIPRELRKFCYMQRDERRMQCQRGSKFNRFSGSQNNLHDEGVRNTGVVDCINQTASRSSTIDGGSQDGLSSSHKNGCLSGGKKVRKRKSRWDQPVWTKRSSQPGGQPNGSSIIPEVEQSQGSKTIEGAPDYCIKADSRRKNVMDDDGCPNMDEDAPPGFFHVSTTTHPPKNDFHCSDCNSEAVSGYPQEKFISRLPLSYGISLCHVMQYGTPDVENVENWVVAPSLPFHPFPPLPSYPRDQRKPSPPFPVKTKDSSSSGDVQYKPDKAPSTSGRINSPAIDVSGDISQQTSKRARISNDLGQRYFRQQKLNNSTPPPWVRQRIGRGMGNNSRNGMCNAYSSESVGGRWENSGNNNYHHQQSEHPNYH